MLDLKCAFGTSHSVTTSRTNAVITFRCGQMVGYGEVGLPPKKAGVYFSDLGDVEKVVRLFLELESEKEELFAALLDLVD